MEKRDRDLATFAARIVPIGCVFLYAAWWLALVLGWSPDYLRTGQFGDSFGPITGFLSSLTLAAAIVSVIRQTQELQLQRDELAETRGVLGEQQAAQDRLARAQEAANVIAKAQHDLDERRFAWDTDEDTRRHERELLATHAQAMHAAVAARVAGVYASELVKDVDGLLAEVQESRTVNASRRR